MTRDEIIILFTDMNNHILQNAKGTECLLVNPEIIADWHLAEVKRILEPLINHMNNNANTFGEGRQQAIDETLKRAGEVPK